MRHSVISGLRAALLTALLAVVPTLHAQTAANDFSSDPDKTMAAAHESFVKGDMSKASAEIGKASAYVKKEANAVAEDAKSGVIKASAQLDELGKSVQAGTVKSERTLKRTFAQVDHALAKAWHETAVQTQKAGNDAGSAASKAAEGLEGAAKWSGDTLQQGAQAGVEGAKKLGQGVETGTEDLGKWLQGIGEGVQDMGRRLKAKM
jgi:hypothetical protein